LETQRSPARVATRNTGLFSWQGRDSKREEEEKKKDNLQKKEDESQKENDMPRRNVKEM
jgi:hypothetical protein